jgi:glycosyltransferase involved in cell wall biosynthesis
MKVAILGIKTFPAFAGADRVVEKYLENADKSDEFFIYLSFIDNKYKLTDRDNLHFIYVPTIPSKYFKAFIFFFLSSVHFLLKGKFNIAHIHNSDFGIFNFIIFLKRRTKIIATFHGNPYQREKWSYLAKLYLRLSEKFFLRFSDILTTVAESKIEEVPEKYRNKIVYIPNGIDNSDEIYKDNNDFFIPFIRSSEYIVFACGRLDSTKGLHYLIDAFVETNYDLKLVIVGDFSHDKIYSENIYFKIKNDNRIIVYPELLPKSSLFALIKNSKFFVFPSEVEAMSMMLLEVISLKVPVICSDINENISVVGMNYKYLFKAKSTQSLREKIDQMMMDQNTKSVADELLIKIRTKFDWKTIASQYQNLYKRLFD